MLAEPFHGIAAGELCLPAALPQFLYDAGNQLPGDALPGEGRVNEGVGDVDGVGINGWKQDLSDGFSCLIGLADTIFFYSEFQVDIPPFLYYT